MAKLVDPKVNVISYGPIRQLDKGQVISPDEWVWGASGITYKDIGTVDELRELKAAEEDIQETVTKSLVNSAGAGHASMATTPGLWVMLEGNCSKMVDSMFTGVRYGSSLMPSGRRVPVTVEQIIIPEELAKMDKETQDRYLQASEANIRAYEELQERGVPKQEAAKIVQYGHRGGGFLFIPLETLISISKSFELGNNLVPQEGREIIRQLEDYVKENGMGIVYHARRAAPRTGCPNPGIFHTTKNFAQELVEENTTSPRIVSSYGTESAALNESVQRYLKKRAEMFKNRKSIENGWPGLLQELEEVVRDFNDVCRVTTFANSPWRVWGEVKRHRTLSQSAESIYSAVGRAQDVLVELDQLPKDAREAEMKILSSVLSLPKEIVDDKENYDLWVNRFKDSIEVYRNLVYKGISPSEAIHVVPRGLKLGITKTYDPYNLTTGMMSLRLCNDVEPEMRRTTQAEYDLVMSSEIPQAIKDLMMVKCQYTGFCHNRSPCTNIKSAIPNYDQDRHKEMQKLRTSQIRGNIE